MRPRTQKKQELMESLDMFESFEQFEEEVRHVFKHELNRMLVKMLVVNAIAILGAAASVGIAWYRLADVEEQVRGNTEVISEGSFLKGEAEARESAIDSLRNEFQPQINANKRQMENIQKTTNRIEGKLDRYIFGN